MNYARKNHYDTNVQINKDICCVHRIHQTNVSLISIL